MPKYTLTFLALVFIAVTPAPAHAHLFLEPDVGYEVGTSTQDFKWTSDPEAKASFSQSGSTLGAAFGYRQNMAYFAAQIERGLGGHVTDITGLVGANFAIRYRFWIGWIVSSKDDVSSGSGFKAGAGWAMTKTFRLNVEYDHRSYDKYTDVSASGLTYYGTHNTFKATLSIPFQL